VGGLWAGRGGSLSILMLLKAVVRTGEEEGAVLWREALLRGDSTSVSIDGYRFVTKFGEVA
jgi:hypothetical protein